MNQQEMFEEHLQDQLDDVGLVQVIGCLSRRASRVASLDDAGRSSPQSKRTAAFKFLASSFERMAAARCCSSSFARRAGLLEDLTGIESIGLSLFHSTVSLLMMLLGFLLSPPLYRLVSLTDVNGRRSFHAVLLMGAPMIL